MNVNEKLVCAPLFSLFDHSLIGFALVRMPLAPALISGAFDVMARGVTSCTVLKNFPDQARFSMPVTGLAHVRSTANTPVVTGVVSRIVVLSTPAAVTTVICSRTLSTGEIYIRLGKGNAEEESVMAVLLYCRISVVVCGCVWT
jgi:hypothetical protein